MSITAKRGDYRIVDEIQHRSVESRLLLHAATFSPNASLSRSEITDSGTRYEIQVVQDIVRIRRTGGQWQTLEPAEPNQPWGRSFQNKRNGESIDSRRRFDMIAASRGRLLAKEAGTDRFFSLIIDPLFRTSTITLSDATVVTEASDGGDPVVPSTYLKLDPEYFTPAKPAVASARLKSTYAHHPASERFRVFVLQLEAQLSDMWCVLPRAGVWHLLDTRSPLKVTDLDDVNCLDDKDVKKAFTQARIAAVLSEFGRAWYREQDLLERTAELNEWLADEIGNRVPSVVSDRLRDLRDAADSIDNVIGDIVGFASQIPVIGGAVRALRSALAAVRRVADGLANTIVSGIRDKIGQLGAPVADKLVALASNVVAAKIYADVQEYGIAGLFASAWLGGALIIQKLTADEIVLPVNPLPTTITPNERPCRDARKVLGVHLGKLKKFANDQNSNALGRLVDAVVEESRRRRGVDIPNAPHPELPTYRHLAYEQTGVPPLIPPRRYERTAIKFSRVLDLAVGTVHWSEQWHSGFGGEMHAIAARRPVFQQEQFGLALYRFLNGPVIDGDGWQDGTTNFYILVKLDGMGTAPSQRKFAVLFLDEQSYFTQRWRLVHPLKDIAGDVFSIARQLKESPEYFEFHASFYWDPFEAGHITDHSRMGVARQIIAVTGFDPNLNEAEIYTFCFAWGLSDRTWRWRKLPVPAAASVDESVLVRDGDLPANQGEEQVFHNTIAIREDSTISVRGWGRPTPGSPPVQGRWFQRYLPSHCQHAPMAHELRAGKPARGFDHPWTFVSEPAYQAMDAFYQLGVYEKRVDSRCQYYPVDVLPSLSGARPGADVLRERTWRNAGVNPLRIDTMHVNWELPENGDGYVPVSEALRDHGARSSMSMYGSTTEFRLLERGPLGWIAVFHDKRDDDLQAASHLPRRTRFTSDGPNWRQLDVVVRENRRVARPPVVSLARVLRRRERSVTTAVLIEFWAPLGVDEAYENLWRMAIGSPANPGVFSSEVHGVFVREAFPTSPLPLGAPAAIVRIPAYRFSYEWTSFDRATIDALFTAQAMAMEGASVWFENVVGHFARPDEVEFGEV